MNNFTLFSHLEVHSIKPNNAIHSIQFSASPLLNIRNNPIGNLGQYTMRYLCVIHLFNMITDVSISHSKTIHTNYFVCKTIGQNGLSFLVYIWFKTTLAVLWCGYFITTVPNFNRLLYFPITFVAFCSFLIFFMC